LVPTVPPIRYARSGDINIAFQVFGDGPTDIVVTPGFTSHLDLQWTLPSFTSFAERLGSFARVILFDKRGTGLSDPTPGAVAFEARIDDIEAVMDAAGSEKATLFGVSEGAPLSALFAATHPERINSLVLYGSFARGSQIPADQLSAFEDAVAHWGEGRTAALFSTTEGDSAVRRRLAGMFERASASPGMAHALIQSIKELDVTTALESLAVPTLILRRTDDPFASEVWSQEMAKRIPDARLVSVPGSEHLPWFGDCAELVGEIEDFVTGYRRAYTGSTVLATILFTDIVDSTKHASEIGDAAWRELLERHNAIIRHELESFRGREIKTTGDGFLATFDVPARATLAAQAMIQRVQDVGIEIRAGVHIGECEVFDDGDVGGMAVHIAARVGAMARPGEVLVSSTVKELVIGSNIGFADRGIHQLKGVPGEWHLFRVTASPTGHLESQTTQERRLRGSDKLSLFLARRAPRLIRSLAAAASSEN
jgi:pimeloyl-ACP methyl ester carboxylesterase